MVSVRLTGPSRFVAGGSVRAAIVVPGRRGRRLKMPGVHVSGQVAGVRTHYPEVLTSGAKPLLLHGLALLGSFKAPATTSDHVTGPPATSGLPATTRGRPRGGLLIQGCRLGRNPTPPTRMRAERYHRILRVGRPAFSL